MFRRSIILIAGLVLFSKLLFASAVALNENHPDTYVVQKGDTLWDISAMFLRNPWQWPNIWEANPQIANPHLIYPGDVLELAFIDGKPVLRKRTNGIVKLSPEVRVSPLNDAIDTISINDIAGFLTNPYVLEEDQADKAGYIVAMADEHLIGGADQKFYARNVKDADSGKFDIVRPGNAYVDADTGEVLGYEAEYIGTSSLIREGDPATFRLIVNRLEMLAGDRLISVSENESFTNFYPKAPTGKVDGSIIDVLNGVSQIGQFQIVVLDKGRRDGIEVGDVLVVDNLGETIRDHYHGDTFATVKLPNEEAGQLMVFRLFDKVSFGIIMSAKRAMHVLDRVRNPE